MLRKRGGMGIRGQVTFFVIIGLALIIVAYLLFQLAKPANVTPQEAIQSVPEEFQPVQNYVETCMHKITLQGIQSLGEHGGYIDPLNVQLTRKTFSYLPSKPTESSLVSLTGNDDSLVPYYLYVQGKASYDNYDYYTAAPTAEDMQNQLARYVESQMGNCLGDFREIENTGISVVDAKQYQATVTIDADKIKVYLKNEINISNDNTRTQLSSYNTVVRFPLLKYLELAQYVTRSAYLTQFSESFTTALINYHSGVDFSKLPPFIDHNTLPYAVSWNRDKVQNDMDILLSSYVPALRVVGTKGFKELAPSGDEIEDAFFESLTMDIFGTQARGADEQGFFRNLSVTFFYRPQTVSLSVSPSEGSTIRPDIEYVKGSKYIPDDKDFTYQFYYDVSYPLFVEIRGDEPNYELPEFSWIFALESDLIENKAPLAWQAGLGTQDWDPSSINMTVNFPPGSTVDENGGQVNEETSKSTSKSLFCNRDTWISGDVTVNTVDARGGDLDGVSVSYGCGDHASCYVGETYLSGNGATWTGRLPLCEGGYLVLSKDGYGAKKLTLSTYEDHDSWLGTQALAEAHPLKVSVKKKEIMAHIYRDDDWNWQKDSVTLGSAQDLDPSTEQVILTITQAGISSDDAISETLLFGMDGTADPEISLVPGDYDVTATFIDNSGLTIPANCTRICSSHHLIGGCSDYDYLPSDPVNMDSAVWGGLDFSREGAGTITIGKDDLYSSGEIQFYVLKLPNLELSTPPGGCLDSLDEMNSIGEYTSQFSADLQPELN